MSDETGPEETTDLARRCAEAAQDLVTSPPTDGCVVDEVRAEGEQVAIVFRWHDAPHPFVIRLATDSWAYGLDLDGAKTHEIGWPAAWADDVRFWLMEELATGYVGRASRRADGDRVELVPPDPASGERTTTGAPVYVTDVPQYPPSPPAEIVERWDRMVESGVDTPTSFGWISYGRGEPGDGLTDGAHLTEAGLDAAAARRLRQEGELGAWLQAMPDDEHAGWAGHVVLGTVRDGVVPVLLLETTPGAPQGTHDALLAGAVVQAEMLGGRTLVVDDEDGHREISTSRLDG
ncbi:hypothetical protein GCM10009633_00270 [Janibacter melonis]|uniref:hypothetical protein n=1 Tax=Janibacter melonis TaxID=262209 RepID=UPI001E3922E5|nr:hypothetical protein [Janibacter melonis]MCB5989984.1 hypothetical protein [Janibacter melonis]